MHNFIFMHCYREYHGVLTKRALPNTKLPEFGGFVAQIERLQCVIGLYHLGVWTSGHLGIWGTVLNGDFAK